MMKWVPRVEFKNYAGNMFHLSVNPNAVDFLTEHPHLVSINILSNPNPEALPLIRMKLAQLSNDQNVMEMMSANPNPGVISLLEDPEYAHMRQWCSLSANPAAINLLEDHHELINYNFLCINPKARSLIQDLDHLTEKQLCFLASNRSKWAMEMIEPYLGDVVNPEKKYMVWHNLSSNPFAVPLMEKYPECVNIGSACRNPKAIHIVKSRLDDPSISLDVLSYNEAAIDLLRANPKKIKWGAAAQNKNFMQLWDEFKDKMMEYGCIWRQPDMFVPLVDYQAIRERHVVVAGKPVYFSEVLKELTALYYHPSRMDPKTFDLDCTKSVFSSRKRKRDV
jgi:hypothetical protein